MKKFPSQTQDKFTVRFPDGMRDAIAKRAEANGRSMNSEIIKILQNTLDNKNQINFSEDTVKFVAINIGNKGEHLLTIDLDKIKKFIKK
ncbi:MULTISPECIES: Arc family DNA-binding protein [Arsenophonus]|uniref:Arc family DNA-binding protein n=1 Tax=Arsenophonus TaxID=637 RepID=UPI0035C07E27